jgi:hypothetical protein
VKKGTEQHTDGWDAPKKSWTHMVLHLPHDEVGFGVTFNDVTKDYYFTLCGLAWCFLPGTSGVVVV